jgi:prefoldin subunit 5
MQSMLERKYTPWLKRYAALRKDSEVLERWREDLAQGEVPGAMWAALTHPAASEGTRSRIHADVHMLSHQLVAGQAEALRRVARLEQNNAQAERRLAELARRHAETMAQARDQLQSLQRECHRLQAEARQMEPLRERLARFESGQIMVDLGRRLFMLEAANADLRARVTRLKELETSMQALQIQLASLAKARDAIAAERDALEYLLLADETASEACAGDCVRCPEWLRGRCVLCVGGRTALLAQYRRLAERLGVRLIHHDGGREDALSRLPELLGTADAVICPTDSISHAAYGQLKRHCKHTRKPCVLARTSGIAGFAAALARLAEGRADQRNQLLHMEA